MIRDRDRKPATAAPGDDVAELSVQVIEPETGGDDDDGIDWAAIEREVDAERAKGRGNGNGSAPITEAELDGMLTEFDERHPHAPGADDDTPPVDGVSDMLVDDGRAGRDKGPSQATELLGMALDAGITAWRTPDDDPHVTIDGAHLRLCDRRVRGWLRRLWHRSRGGALRREVVSDVVGTIEGLAYSADEDVTHVAHHRVAGDQDAIYIHVGHGEGVIEVTRARWCMATDPPVRMVATRGMLSLARPSTHGDLSRLRDLHPALRDDDTYALIVSWLVGCMRPWGSYAILVLLGEHGSAKSSLARTLQSIVDPCEAGLRSPPRDERALSVAVRASRVLALDNVGSIQPWLSDALCVVATGGTFAARELYTDGDEYLIRARQPIVMSGIADVGVRVVPVAAG